MRDVDVVRKLITALCYGIRKETGVQEGWRMEKWKKGKKKWRENEKNQVKTNEFRSDKDD